MESPAIAERFFGTDQKRFSTPLLSSLHPKNRLESVGDALLKMGRKSVINTGEFLVPSSLKCRVGLCFALYTPLIVEEVTE